MDCLRTVPAKTHSDRMIYARRDVGTRSRVNWYRGAPDKDDTIPGSFNETTTAPDQTTHYETSDDPTADPDNPAADGTGSRHNYEVIGQVPISYDNNRNVMADGTREFRYNYRNQLRSVWRKSDGEDSGRVAMYREDAFGRRVLAWTWWELSRRVYFDTRFERDIDLDPDGDSTDMEIIDGGITSNAVTEQTASWESRIYRPYNASFEAHYYDFLVHVPTPSTSTAYLGKVAVGTRELRIYGDRYALYNNGSHVNTYNAPGGSTAGWRNIGLRAGLGADTYIDGIATGIGGAVLGVNQTVEFGTMSVDDGPGIRLFDNLNYLRSFNRTLAGASGGGYPTVSAEGSSQAAMLCGYTQGGGGVQLLDGGPFGTDFMPRVKATGFDGPAAQSMFELTADGESVETAVAVEYEEDSTRARHFTGDGEFTDLYLVNPRRGTAVTVRDDADGLVDDEGELVEHDGLLPGAHIYLHHDAVGAVTGSMRVDPAAPSLPWGESAGDNVRPVAVYELDGLPMLHGNGVVESDYYVPITSTPPPPPEDPRTYHGEPPNLDGDDGAYTAGSATCCFAGDNSTLPQPSNTTNSETGNQHNNNEGEEVDPTAATLAGESDGDDYSKVVKIVKATEEDKAHVIVTNEDGTTTRVEYTPDDCVDERMIQDVFGRMRHTAVWKEYVKHKRAEDKIVIASSHTVLGKKHRPLKKGGAFAWEERGSKSESAIILSPELFSCAGDADDYIEGMAEAGTTIWHEMQHYFEWRKKSGYDGGYGEWGEPYARTGPDGGKIDKNPEFEKKEEEFKKWWKDFWGTRETSRDITQLESDDRDKALENERDALKGKGAANGKHGHSVEKKGRVWEGGRWRTKIVYRRPWARSDPRKNADGTENEHDKKHLGK